jgi:hypothetical protein
MASASASAADQTVLVEPDEIGPLQPLVANPGLEHQGVISSAGRPDLADIAEVLEHDDHGLEDATQRVASAVRGVHHGAAEDDVFAKQRRGGVKITRFDRVTECVHGG